MNLFSEEPEEEPEEEEEDIIPAIYMKPYQDVIKESQGTIIDCLVLNKKMLDVLEENMVINLDMRSKIVCRPCRAEKVKVLLKFMMDLGPASLESFVLALRTTDQNFLANILSAEAFI